MFNIEQARGLSTFFFDIGKGLILGGVGIYFLTPIEARLVISIFIFLVSYFCVYLALEILK